jgi:glycosyltransferase involved in cell wall biosynthesis
MPVINIVVPTFNEEDNVIPISQAIIDVITNKLPDYDYRIIFIDNCSKDKTRLRLIGLCENNKKIQAIFNTSNFGQFRSPFYGLQQTTGDCNILMASDFQDPPELIYDFVKKWEEGYKVVISVKSKSTENKLIYACRSLYYKVIKKISDVEQIEHFTGFGLYDKAFIDVIKDLKDPNPYIRGIVSELGFQRAVVEFTQPKRLHGKSHNNFFILYDCAMVGITSYSKTFLRMATFIGFILAGLCFIAAIIYLILKIVFWNSFAAGMAPLLIGVFFLGAIQIFFIGILGEYILSINTRVMQRPLVVEEKRINFDNK